MTRPFYDNSPGMVDDIVRPAAVPAASPTPAANLLGDSPPAGASSPSMGTGWFDKSDMVADVPRATAAAPAPKPADTGFEALQRAPLAEKAMPYGSDVQIGIARAAEANGLAPDEAAAAGEGWAGVFAAHGIPDGEITHLIDAGLTISKGLPDAGTEAGWAREATEGVNAKYGGPENGARLLEVARRYVQAHPALNDYLTRTRLGSHPRVVATIVGVAHRAHMAGRMK